MKKLPLNFPPKTRLTVQVGVTGHRSLPCAELGLLRASIAAALKEITRATADVAASATACCESGEPVFRMISMLAEGADQAAAQAALAEGWRLQCVLPMGRALYEHTMDSGAGRAEFRRLLGESETVFEIDCPSPTDSRAYQNGAQVMLGHCDFLLAVWDGKDSGRVGGTGDTVDEAVRQDIPVLWIDSKAPHGIRMLYGGKTEGDWRSAVRRELIRMLVPVGEEGPDFPAIFFRERLGSKSRAKFYTRFMRLLTAPHGKQEFTAPMEADPFYLRQYGRYYACADELACRYGDTYRSAGLLRQLLPFIAGIGLGIGFYISLVAGPGTPSAPLKHTLDAFSAVGFAIQAACFVAVIVLARLNKERHWQRKFIEYRMIAELFRQMQCLAGAGLVVRGLRIPAYSGGQNAPWVNWYFRAVARQAGLPTGIFTRDSLLESATRLRHDMIEGQIQYQHAASDRIGRAASRLEQFGLVLYYSGIAVAIVRALWFYLVTGGGMQAAVDPKFSTTFFNMLSFAVPVFSGLAFGISSQEGLGFTRMHAKAMAGMLETAKTQLDVTGCTDFNAFIQVARRTASLMLSEFSDWSSGIRERAIGDH